MHKRIDVVRDFLYTSENKRYNRDYQRWRKSNKGSYMYRYAGNPEEVVYVDGKAVFKPDAGAAEQQALMHCSELIGMALLIYLVAELVGGTLLIGLLRLLGLNIHLDFLTLSMEGGSQWAVAGVRAAVLMMKYGLPALLLQRFVHLPHATAFPARIGGLHSTLAAVGAAMLIAGIYSINDAKGGLDMAQQIFEYKNSAAIATYGLFDVVVASLLAEMLLRGCLLPLLRQFGDSFAVIMIATMGFLFPNALPARISEFLLGIASCYLLIRSGSFAKCVLLRVVYTMLTYTRLIRVYATNEMPLWQYALLLISFGALAIALYVHMQRGHLLLDNRHTQLSKGKKLATVVQTVTMLPWLAVSALLTLLQMFF